MHAPPKRPLYLIEQENPDGDSASIRVPVKGDRQIDDAAWIGIFMFGFGVGLASALCGIIIYLAPWVSGGAA